MRLASRARPGSFFRALLFALLPATCTAQTAHDLVMGRELAFTGAGLGTSGIGLVLRRSNARRPAPMIAPERVPGIDRWSTRQWHPGAHRASNVLFVGTVTASFAVEALGCQTNLPDDARLNARLKESFGTS